MKRLRFIDSLPSYLLSDAPHRLCESGYKSDSSRYVRRTSRNMLKLRKMFKWNFLPGFLLFSGMRQCRFRPWNKPMLSSLQLELRPPVSRLCLYIIDSQRRRLLANRLPRQFFLKREGSRWSDEIRVTFGWPLLDKDSLHQLSSVILPCFYATGAFVGFSVQHHTLEITLKQIYF